MPPRIWWITHEFLPFRGGAAVYVEEIARAAAKLSIPAQVVAADYRRRLNASQRAKMNVFDAAQPYPVVRLKCSGRLTPAGILRLAAGIHGQRRSMTESYPVLLSAGAQMAAFLLHAFGQFSASRTTCFFHGSELLRFARHPFWRPMARRFYAHSAGFAVASEFVRDLALKSGLLPANASICLARCAVPSAYLETKTGEEEQGGTGTTRVLTVARLHPRKGQLQVAEALAMLPQEQRSRLVYVLVGTGDSAYRSQVEAVCRQAQIRSEFLGEVDAGSLARIYSESTIYAQASQTLPQSVEGFGISLLEAAYFGCPISAFRSGGVAEAVREGHNAILVGEGDVAALSAAVGKLITDLQLRRRLGAAGREYARTFSWPESAHTIGEYVYNINNRNRL